MKEFKHILFATDFSDCADHAFKEALYLAKVYDATLHILNVSLLPVSFPYLEVDYNEEASRMFLEKHIAKLMKEIKDSWDEEKIKFHVDHAFEVSESIVDFSNKNEIDLIVMGTHGRSGFQHAMIGSITEKVIRKSELSVYVVHEKDDFVAFDKIKEVCVPIDFSAHSKKALRFSSDLARKYHFHLNMLHVVPEMVQLHADATYIDIRQSFPQVLDEAMHHLNTYREKECADYGSVKMEVVAGDIVTELIKFIEESKMELVIISTRGLSEFKHFFLGSITERLLQKVKIPVFVIN